MLLLAVAVGLGACSSTVSVHETWADRCRIEEVAAGVRVRPHPYAQYRAVVFVHGFSGSGASLFDWARVLCEEQAARLADPPSYDALIFEYPSRLTGCPQDLSGAAASLGRFLSQPMLSGYQELVLVAHSFGGLVSLRYTLDGLLKKPTSRLLVRKVLLVATPIDGASLAAWGQHFSCQAAAAAVGSKELGQLQSDLLSVAVPGRSVLQKNKTEIEIRVLVAAHDWIVAPVESLMQGTSILTEKINNVSVEGSLRDAGHLNVVEVTSRDHGAHDALRKLLRTAWATVTRPGQIGIRVAMIRGEHGDEQRRTLTVLLRDLAGRVPELAGRIDVRTIEEDLGTCEEPNRSLPELSRLLRTVNARILLWGEHLTYGPQLRTCVLSLYFGEWRLRLTAPLKLNPGDLDIRHTVPTLGPPVVAASLALLGLLIEEDQLQVAEQFIAGLLTEHPREAEGYPILSAMGAVVEARAAKEQDAGALARAVDYWARAEQDARGKKEEVAADQIALMHDGALIQLYQWGEGSREQLPELRRRIQRAIERYRTGRPASAGARAMLLDAQLVAMDLAFREREDRGRGGEGVRNEETREALKQIRTRMSDVRQIPGVEDECPQCVGAAEILLAMLALEEGADMKAVLDHAHGALAYLDSFTPRLRRARRLAAILGGGAAWRLGDGKAIGACLAQTAGDFEGDVEMVGVKEFLYGEAWSLPVEQRGEVSIAELDERIQQVSRAREEASGTRRVVLDVQLSELLRARSRGRRDMKDMLERAESLAMAAIEQIEALKISEEERLAWGMIFRRREPPLAGLKGRAWLRAAQARLELAQVVTSPQDGLDHSKRALEALSEASTLVEEPDLGQVRGGERERRK